ncbi:integrase, catalytic region, zinc finger, CCHC-type containing protein [Tanacetum coccineum]
MKCVTMNTVKPKVLAPGMYAIDVEPTLPRNRNNREVHLDYLKHLKECVETLYEIAEEARIKKSLDNALENAYFYTKRSQELLEYMIGTCPKESDKRDKKAATTPLSRNKQVAFRETCETLNNNPQTHVKQQKVHKTNVPVILSTGVNSSTEASGSKPRSNTKHNRNLPAKSDNKKKVKDHPRNNKSNLKQENRVDSSISSKRTVINLNSKSMCKTCRIDHPLVFGLRLLKTYDGESLTGQFCDLDLEVAFRKHSCYVRDVDDVDLIKGSRGSNLYTISVEDMMKSSPICLLSKAYKNKSWLWHRRLNHLNFSTVTP